MGFNYKFVKRLSIKILLLIKPVVLRPLIQLNIFIIFNRIFRSYEDFLKMNKFQNPPFIVL